MHYWLALLLALSSSLCASNARERVVGLPCEGCEAVFEGQPEHLSSRARIGQRDEQGDPMLVTGKVIDAQGRPAGGVVAYAYQTNSKGIYPTSDKNRGQAAHRHGTLRAWALTDAQGRYAFDTIRPAGYPGTDLPAHIHMHIIERGRCTYYIDDIMFSDDPRLTPERIRRLTLGRGGNGVGQPLLRDGVWYITRDVVLGKNVPDHKDCAP
jgi:protocatechuate 3,4-dioxygenase beta subunit